MYFCVDCVVHVLFVCKCVLLPPGVNPIAVKYIISRGTLSGASIANASSGNCVLTRVFHAVPSSSEQYVTLKLNERHDYTH